MSGRNDEAEFASITSKKNLRNTQSKLSRNMKDLAVLYRSMVKDVYGISSSEEAGLPESTVPLEPNLRDEIIGSVAAWTAQHGHRETSPTTTTSPMNTTQTPVAPFTAASSKRRSSFQSGPAERHAERMQDLSLAGDGTQMSELLGRLSGDISVKENKRAQKAVLDQELRDLMKIDDRLDLEAILWEKYKAGGGQYAAWLDDDTPSEEVDVRRRDDFESDEEDDAAGFSNPRLLPRVRHTRSYRLTASQPAAQKHSIGKLDDNILS